MKPTFFLLVAFLASLLTPAGAAQAQGFPSKPIRVIAPYPPGGTTDLIARSYAEQLTKSLGQPALVENRPGAAGMIGAEIVAKSPGDAHIVLVGSQALYTVNPVLYPRIAYDPVKDFTPVSLVANIPSYLVVPASFPASTLREFIAHVKTNPGTYAYGSAGAGTSENIFPELFKQQAGVDLTHVPYKGSTPAVTDLIAERVVMMIELGPSVIPHVKSGRLKALGVSTARRSIAMPEVPTIAEGGVPGFDGTTWFAIHAAAGIPKEVLARLNAEAIKMLAAPELRGRLLGAGLEPVGSSSEDLAETQRREAAKWADVVRRANIRLE